MKRVVELFETDEQRQIACVLLLPHFFWQAAASGNAELRQAPVIVASSTAGSPHRTVVDTSPGLTGVLCGMPTDQALSRAPEAVLVNADIPAAEALFETVLSALEQVGPDIEPAEPGVVYIDARGLERLYGGDAQLVRVLSAAVRRVSDFDLRIGLGPSKWLAYVAAIHSRSGSAYKLTEASKKFLDSLPVSLLPVDPKTIGRMDEFGLTKLGDISSKPRGTVHAQFGYRSLVICCEQTQEAVTLRVVTAQPGRTIWDIKLSLAPEVLRRPDPIRPPRITMC